MSKKKPLDLKAIKEIIVPLREKGAASKEMADALNKKGITTARGLEWTASNVVKVGLANGWFSRVRSTTRGEAGSTGNTESTRYSKLNGRSLTPTRTKRNGTSYNDIEDVMTSNLSPKLKLKLIARLAKEIE